MKKRDVSITKDCHLFKIDGGLFLKDGGLLMQPMVLCQ